MSHQEEWARRREEEEKEEEEELDETDYRDQKDAILFAIEISSSMLKKPPPSDSKKADTDSAAAAALKCAYQIMQQRIISNPKDMMGILLFGTEKSRFHEQENSRGSLLYDHCYSLIDLDIPAAEDVKALKKIVEDEEEKVDLLVPTNDPPAMAHVLFCANQIFTTKAPNFGSRRLFIVTDNDNPHPHNTEQSAKARSGAQVRAKDLYDLGVVIELFPISRGDSQFEKSKFYDDLIYTDVSDPEAALADFAAMRIAANDDGISLLQSLVSNVNSKQVAKRALFANLPFEIGPGLKISIRGYNIFHRQLPARSCYIYLDGETAQIVSSERTQTTDEADGDATQGVPSSQRQVQKSEVKKAYKFGGEQVLFTKEEMAQLKDYGSPVLRIIGFKPQSLLPDWASINKSTFIYPSEDDYIGSTRVFAALWQKLLRDKKMGIAWYIARKNAKPMIVAIIPSPETLNEAGQQSTPPGLWLYPLPYADDLRSPPETSKPIVCADALVDKMRTVIEMLQLPGAKYDPSRYPNPSLQWHYRILQAIALDEEIPEFADGDDKTVPRYRQIHKRAGAYLLEYGEALEEQYNAMMANRPSNKHALEDDTEGQPKKKRGPSTKKESASLITMSSTELKTLVRTDKLKSYTVADLKELCATRSVSAIGLKADLIGRLEEDIEKD